MLSRCLHTILFTWMFSVLAATPTALPVSQSVVARGVFSTFAYHLQDLKRLNVKAHIQARLMHHEQGQRTRR